MDSSTFFSACPIPLSEYPHILMGHGGGGRLSQKLINDIFLTAFGTAEDGPPHDSAVLEHPPGRLAFTTDSYVVRPLFFPGGNIGSMAVYGTVNDLAMSGARPRWISVSFILEEGLAMETLWRVVCSMREAARRCSVKIVTGDTKVVEKGRGDGMYINTSGIGIIEHPLVINPASVEPGDAILVSGDLARHGMAIMSAREGLEFQSTIESDSAPVSQTVEAILAAGLTPHCLRDLTRGGLASTLNEISEGAHVRIQIDHAKLPVHENVRAACELLGLDPLHVACEGRFAVILPADQADRALEILRRQPDGQEACQIGMVAFQGEQRVMLKTEYGSLRILDMPAGEQLPRIC
jgi:hydrogenase expression/formation protein HypE